MSEVYAIDLDEVVESTIYLDLYNVLSEERKLKTDRYKFEIDAKRSICAEVLVKYLLQCHSNGACPAEIGFKSNQYGKLYFDGISDYYFNISHSGKWVVCAWSRREIGVDVEKIKDIDIDVAKHYFTKAEYHHLISKEAVSRKNYLIELWTLKESYVKYKGKGLSMSLDRIHFYFKDGKVCYDCDHENNLLFRMLHLDDEHRLAVCSLDSVHEEVRVVSLKTIWGKLCND
jgi:4'-phosphopantetheinyl transferase